MSAAGDAQLELMRELRALEASGAPWAPFDAKRVGDVVASITHHHRALQDTTANPYVRPDDPYFGACCHFHRHAALRGKRCLGAYLQWRLSRLSQLWWECREAPVLSDAETAVGRGAGAAGGGDSGVTAATPDSERAYLQQMGSLVVDYMGSFPVALDLRAFTSRPPNSPPTQLVEVRGKADCAFVSPVSGKVLSVSLGKQCTVLFEDAELLLRQDAVELVESGE